MAKQITTPASNSVLNTVPKDIHVERLGIELIVGNPRNARNLALDDERKGLDALKKSIMKAGFEGDPIQVVPVDDEVVNYFFGGKAPEEKFMVVSGHRRYLAMSELYNEAVEKLSEGSKSAKPDTYATIPALIRSDLHGHRITLAAVVTNYNRQDVDVVSKARAAHEIREAVFNEKLNIMVGRTTKDETKKAESIAKLRAAHSTNDLVKDPEIGAIMGTSPATIARFRVLLTFPESLQSLFANGVLKDANISDVSTCLKKVTPEKIIEAVKADKVGTYLSLHAILQELSGGGKKKKAEAEGDGAGADGAGADGGGNGGAGPAGAADQEKERAVAVVSEHFESENEVRAAPGKEAGLTLKGGTLKSLVSTMLGKLPKDTRKALEPLLAIMEGGTLTTTRDGMRVLLNTFDLSTAPEDEPVKVSEDIIADEAPIGGGDEEEEIEAE